ncbi:MAG: family 78 glycoside hydrolase catalytic domain [Fusicatenibacter sp.]|nr:family 78 glycoside hydrolase catalytic domain [Fusicatenibacter sp.]
MSRIEEHAAWICEKEFCCSPLSVFGREQETNDSRNLHPEELKNRHMLVRKKVFTEKREGPLYLEITADDYYKLYVNGKYIGQGPSPGYHWRYYYNRYEVSGFWQEGENVLAVEVYYQGLINRVWNSGDLRQGLCAVLYDADQTVLAATDSGWKYLRSEVYASSGKTFGYDTGFLENPDARKEPRGWKLPGFDDGAWDSAAIHEKDDHVLTPQPTQPLMVYQKKAETVTNQDDHSFLLDFGTELTGMLHIDTIGESGEQVRLRFGEELDEDGRVRYQKRCNCCYEEIWTLSGQRDELENYDYKAFRYVEVKSEHVRPEQVWVMVRHYPMEDPTCLEDCPDEKLAKIWEICARSVMMGTQEVFVDCPSREKGQYLGDLAITAPVQMYLSGDAAMYRKALDNFRDSARIDEGLMAVAPGSLMQEIADYSLLYPYEVYRYYCAVGDEDYLKELYPTICGILKHFSTYERNDGLVCEVSDKWNLVDWPENLRDGYDFSLTRPVCPGCHNVINAFYYGALLYTQKIAKVIGEDERWLERKREQVKKAFRDTFYRPDRKLFVDSEGSEHTSVHANGIPLFFSGCRKDSPTGEIAVSLAESLAPGESFETMADLIQKKGLCCGVYTAYFLLKGLANVGKYQEMYDLMTNESGHSWMNMIREGATTCFEAWGKEQKWNTSLCHPWGSGPILLILEDIAGISWNPKGGITRGKPHLPKQLPRLGIRLHTNKE